MTPMTADQYRTVRDELGLRQLEAARLFGVTDRTARRWATDGVTGSAVIALRLLAWGRITMDDVRAAVRGRR